MHTVPAPYELTIDADELIYPSTNSRRSKKTNEPPRPQNSFLLFRKDFEAKYRSLHKGEKIIAKKISSLAAQRWSEQPPSVRIFFKQLEIKALKKHKEMFPNYRYQPNKKKQDLKNNVLEDANCLNSGTLSPQSVESSGPSSESLDPSTTNSQDVVHDINTFFTPN
ncbi:32148_t:CDS:1, partial [Racocetra persica]